MPSINAEWKGENANSYVTLEEVDAYLDNMYASDDWFQLDIDDKMRLIVTATNYIDSLPYKYLSFTETQSLIFPLNKDGIESGEINVKKATMLQTYYMYKNIETIEDSINENISNIKTQNLGSVQITKIISGINPFANYDGKMLKQLSEYLNLSNRRITDSSWTVRPLIRY